MKKLTKSLSIAIVCLFVLTSCKTAEPQLPPQGNTATPPAGSASDSAAADNPGAIPAEITIAVLKGPSSIGLVKLMDEADSGEIGDANYRFEISAAIDEIVPKIVQGSIDIAAVPANMSSVLYNNTQGEIQVLAINSLGMMYIVENGSAISTIEDLRGKTLLASGKGASPEFVLNYILRGNGIDPDNDLTIEWKSEHTESVAALSVREGTIAILPQPFVTVAQTSNDNVRIAIDLNVEWDNLQGASGASGASSALITGVVVARKEFVERNPGAVSAFLDRYAASVTFVNTNVYQAAALVGKYDITPEAVAKLAIPLCNITLIEGLEMKEKLSGYLGVLLEQNPQSVGGALPGDEFYFFR